MTVCSSRWFFGLETVMHDFMQSTTYAVYISYSLPSWPEVKYIDSHLKRPGELWTHRNCHSNYRPFWTLILIHPFIHDHPWVRLGEFQKKISILVQSRASIYLAGVSENSRWDEKRTIEKKLRPPPPLNNNIRASPANTVGPNTQPSTARGERVGGVAILFPDWKSSKFRAPLTARPLSELH